MAAEPLLEARKLRRCYRVSRSAGPRTVVAVDGVSLEVGRGRALGVVGESGSGKSTLARLLMALEHPDSGSVWFDGLPISDLPESVVRPLRRRFQAVFQDPIGSLNPRLRVATIVAEPLAAHRLGRWAERRRRVAELLGQVGLPTNAAGRYPGAFSGGERQRIAIARALAPAPELLVLDEPVSSLDRPVQAQLLELLAELRDRLGLTVVLISHDLRVVAEVTDRTAVMYRGIVVEQGPTATLLSRPAHPYTGALLAAAPRAEAARRAPPRPAADSRRWPAGACRYAPRCPLASDRCRFEPALEPLAEGHATACWHPRELKIEN